MNENTTPFIYSQPWRVVYGSDNRLHLKELVKGFQTKMPSKSTHLVSSIRTVAIKCEVAVDPNGSCADGSRHCISYIQVLGDNTSCQAIFCIVCLLDCLLNCPAITTCSKMTKILLTGNTDVKSIFFIFIFIFNPVIIIYLLASATGIFLSNSWESKQR